MQKWGGQAPSLKKVRGLEPLTSTSTARFGRLWLQVISVFAWVDKQNAAAADAADDDDDDNDDDDDDDTLTGGTSNTQGNERWSTGWLANRSHSLRRHIITGS